MNDDMCPIVEIKRDSDFNLAVQNATDKTVWKTIDKIKRKERNPFYKIYKWIRKVIRSPIKHDIMLNRCALENDPVQKINMEVVEPTKLMNKKMFKI